MPKIEMYTKFLCPYCARAAALFKRKGVAFEDIDVTMDRTRRDEMVARANGRATVPQIFIGVTHIGGSDDLAALDAAGELDRLLAA